MYDSDAVVLKDPQSLFDSYPGVELVGSAGKGPESIGHIWGRTICTGVLLMRTSPALGRLAAIHASTWMLADFLMSLHTFINQTVQITFSSPKHLPRNILKGNRNLYYGWALSSVSLMLFRLEGFICINMLSNSHSQSPGGRRCLRWPTSHSLTRDW